MSGPLGTNEIDEVVSSVRRLVSADTRPRPVTRDLGEDCLLLTPALRVPPEASEAVPLVLTQTMEETALVGGVAADAVLPEEEAALARALADVDPIAESRVAPPVAGSEPAGLQPDADPDTQPDPALPPDLALVEAEWEDEIWSEVEPPLAEIALEAEEAELVPLAADLADAKAEAGLAEEERLSGPDREAPWAQVEGDEADDLSDLVVPFTAAARGAVRAVPETAEPATEPERPSAGGSPAGSGFDSLDLTDQDGNPLTVLDEDALQEVVRQMIREELQGSLGERITRNVRKLVRAEINRALTARSLD